MAPALSEFCYWSPVHGAEVLRVSMADDLGNEFYAFLPSTEGSVARRLREKAASKLEEAIELGLCPGEIRWRS